MLVVHRTINGQPISERDIKNIVIREGKIVDILRNVERRIATGATSENAEISTNVITDKI